MPIVVINVGDVDVDAADVGTANHVVVGDGAVCVSALSCVCACVWL